MDRANWNDLFSFDDGEFCGFSNDLAEGFRGVANNVSLCAVA